MQVIRYVDRVPQRLATGLMMLLLAIDLEAGLACYVEVNAYNSGQTAGDYKLVIID